MTRWFVYIGRCKDGSLYIGMTTDITERIKRHNSGNGAKWITQHGSITVEFTEEFETYIQAHRRELQLKKWTRIKKERLIKDLKP